MSHNVVTGTNFKKRQSPLVPTSLFPRDRVLKGFKGDSPISAWWHWLGEQSHSGLREYCLVYWEDSVALHLQALVTIYNITLIKYLPAGEETNWRDWWRLVPVWWPIPPNCHGSDDPAFYAYQSLFRHNSQKSAKPCTRIKFTRCMTKQASWYQCHPLALNSAWLDHCNMRRCEWAYHHNWQCWYRVHIDWHQRFPLKYFTSVSSLICSQSIYIVIYCSLKVHNGIPSPRFPSFQDIFISRVMRCA